MACAESSRRLIVNADDFGASPAINEAVIQAHQQGILTTASLMVNGAAFSQAVALARENQTLGVGLHLTLVCGASTLSREEIPGLVNEQSAFTNDPVQAGWRYFFQRHLRSELIREMEAQLKRFRGTGLVLDHVNGHLNLHLHPVIFRILLDHAREWGIERVRLTLDPFWLNARIARGNWAYRLSHAFIFGCLSARARPMLRRAGLRHTRAVFGLLQNGRVNEAYVLQLLSRLPRGDSELYSHPSLDQFMHEFQALISPRVKRAVQCGNIPLIRYQDL
jgi:chitin disaccharide deacetylase